MLFNLLNRDKNAEQQVEVTASGISIKRELLFEPLQMVSGVLEKRQTMAILANVLLSIEGNELTLSASDSEIELISRILLPKSIENFIAITLPGRKLIDICRTLPEGCSIHLSNIDESGKIVLTSDRSRFLLATLPSQDFPLIPMQPNIIEFSIKQKILKELASKTYFAIPQQNLRSYLNGMLLEVKDGIITTVASDSIRLAINSSRFHDNSKLLAQVIIPRKTVIEWIRLFATDSDEEVVVGMNSNYINVTGKNFVFTSKLISGKFPNYNGLVPKKSDKSVAINREEFKQALSRMSVLSNEALRGFRFVLQAGLLQLFANNQEHEEAAEELCVDYEGEDVDITFNITYLLDILNVLDSERITIALKDGASGVVIENADKKDQRSCESLYVLMPIRK